jgi:hypothetical protein
MAEQRFPCPSCGASLAWSPGRGLECAACGYTGEVTDPGGAGIIREYRLDRAAIDAARGWGTALKAVRCGACSAVSEIPPDLQASSCAFCGAPQVHDLPVDEALIRPESVLPFQIDRNEAVRRFRGWLSGLWFRPSALKSAAQIESIAGVYVPAWTFDAQASSQWTAEAGYHYQEQETYTEVVDGKREQKTRTVTKTRWQPASGSHAFFYDDWVVQASAGLDQAAVKGLQPFDLKKLVPYDAKFLAGFRAERYAVDLEAGWKVAQTEIGSAEKQACAAEVPGDTHRNLHVHTTLDEVRFKHMLLPVWIAAYRYDGKAYRYLVNGETGKANGDAPISWAKVAAFVVAILVFLGTVLGALATIQTLTQS